MKGPSYIKEYETIMRLTGRYICDCCFHVKGRHSETCYWSKKSRTERNGRRGSK